MKAIINGRIVTPTGTLEGKALLFDEKIRGIVSPAEIGDAEVIDAEGKYVVPGLIDIHIHGYQGADASDGDAEAVVRMAEGLAKNGVTAWLPTTMTLKEETLMPAMEVIRDFVRPADGAKCAGIHLEGPFLSTQRAGAMQLEMIIPPSVETYESFFEGYEDEDDVLAWRRVEPYREEVSE